MQSETIERAVQAIRAQLPKDFLPKLGIVLGTGLGQLGEHIEQVAHIPYEKIPGFFMSTVVGHHGALIAGYLNGLPVVCLQGRVHFYEGVSVDAMATMIDALKFLGCDTLLLTNAAGSLRETVGPGRLMLISDHINLQGINPLVGPNDQNIGARFVSMDQAYDPNLRAHMHRLASEMNIDLAEGVYLAVVGPSFETAAEIRAFRFLGADAVGMSTVPEVILARHCGLKVVAISVISNFAAGMGADMLTHEEHIAVGKQISGTLIALVQRFAADLVAVTV